MSSTGDCTIGYKDKKSKDKIEESIQSDTTLEKKWASFERDVTNNPFHHPKRYRIEKLKGVKTFPPGSHRYRNDPLRVVYYPEKPTKVVYPLIVGTAESIAYKKKSFKGQK